MKKITKNDKWANNILMEYFMLFLQISATQMSLATQNLKYLKYNKRRQWALISHQHPLDVARDSRIGIFNPRFFEFLFANFMDYTLFLSNDTRYAKSNSSNDHLINQKFVIIIVVQHSFKT